MYNLHQELLSAFKPNSESAFKSVTAKARWYMVVHILKYLVYLDLDWLRLTSAVIGYTTWLDPFGALNCKNV